LHSTKGGELDVNTSHSGQTNAGRRKQNRSDEQTNWLDFLAAENNKNQKIWLRSIHDEYKEHDKDMQ